MAAPLARDDRLRPGALRWRRIRRPVGWAALVLGCGYVVFVAAMFVVMCQPPERFGRIMAHVPSLVMSALPAEALWTTARDGSVRVGDLAPDFRLPTVDRSQEVHLADFRGRQPVVLVFGSYT